MLVEASAALALLTVLSLLLLKLALNVAAPRQWTLHQSITDAYMTYEIALAQRVPFSSITEDDSLWPLAPDFTETAVETGRLPGGTPLMATVYRTRFADTYTSGQTQDINPAGMQVWKLQSVVTYQVNNRTYRKARTTTRSQ